jgi:hypothetical protein
MEEDLHEHDIEILEDIGERGSCSDLLEKFFNARKEDRVQFWSCQRCGK